MVLLALNVSKRDDFSLEKHEMKRFNIFFLYLYGGCRILVSDEARALTPFNNPIDKADF